MKQGDVVRVLAPFSDTYPDQYEIVEVVNYGDSVVYVLDGIGGFDSAYLEVA